MHLIEEQLTQAVEVARWAHVSGRPSSQSEATTSPTRCSGSISRRAGSRPAGHASCATLAARSSRSTMR